MSFKLSSCFFFFLSCSLLRYEGKLNTIKAWKNVTKNIITDEIIASHKARLDSLKDALDGTSRSLKELEEGIKQQNIRITDSFGPYLGKEFLEPDRLSELSRIIQGGAASNITEASGIYKESKQAQ